MTAFGDDACSTIEEKAAALLELIVRNHPLVDGNKRLGWAATRVFFLLNGRDLGYDSVDEAESFVASVTTGELDVAGIADWLRTHQRP